MGWNLDRISRLQNALGNQILQGGIAEATPCHRVQGIRSPGRSLQKSCFYKAQVGWGGGRMRAATD